MNQSLPAALFLSLCIPAFANPTAVTAPVGVTPGPDGPSRHTTPVGTVTEHLQPGMNLIGLRLHQSVIASGTIGALGTGFAELSGLKADPSGTPMPALIQGKTYVLEITSGEQTGIIQEITQWQGLRLTLPDDLTAVGVKSGDSFKLRQAATLNSVFDPRSTRLKNGGNPSAADVVLIPQGAAFGDFRACFILRAADIPAIWVDAATYKPVGELPLVYSDGLIVKIHGDHGLDLVVVGEVKPGPTRSVVNPGLNLIATPDPAGARLQELGLENDLTRSDDPMKADQVWIAGAHGGGAFTTYFLDQGGHWIHADSGEPVAGKIPVGSAILVQRKGPAALFCLGD